MLLEQVAAVPPAVDHAKELYALGAVLTIQLGGMGAAWLRNRRGPAEQTKRIELALNNALTPVGIKLDSLVGDMQDMKEHLATVDSLVRGPDGQNGMRGDLRKVEKRMDEFEERERDRLHGSYDRRGS